MHNSFYMQVLNIKKNHYVLPYKSTSKNLRRGRRGVGEESSKTHFSLKNVGFSKKEKI